MDKYVKRIQSRLSKQGFSFTKDQIRGVYRAFVKDTENPTEEEMAKVANQLKHQTKFASKATEAESDDRVLVAVSSQQTETIEITPEENPDIWETLQLSAEEIQENLFSVAQPAADVRPNEDAIASDQQEPNEQAQEENNSIVSAASNLTAQQPQLEAGLIPQSEVAGLVNQAFANQPQGFKDQITEYAMQHAFENVSQVQAFLEQLRGMEFKLLVDTLNDHFQRRGSMLTVLNEVLSGQKTKDSEASQAFFASFNSRLIAFQKEMEAKLSKQGL